jgi:hypothetical protein
MKRGNFNVVAQKAVWLSMLLSHVPACVSATFSFAASPGPEEFIRLLLIVGSQVFFLLKLADVGFLRLRADRSAWIRGLLVVALLHGGVVTRNLESRELQRATPVALSTIWAVVLPAAALLGALALRRIALLKRGAAQARAIPDLHTTFQRLAGWSPLQAQLMTIRAATPLRAPPFH